MSRPANAVITIEHPGPSGMDVALRQLRESLARAGVLPLMKSKSRLFAHYTKTQKRRLKSATARKLQAKRARRAARREELGSSEEIVVNTIAQSVPSLTKAALLHLRATLRSRRRRRRRRPRRPKSAR